MTPTRSDRLVEIHVRWGGDNAVIDVILALARRMNLVLLDAQDGRVYTPSPQPATLLLKTGDGTRITDPEPDVVAYRVRRVWDRVEYAVLEVEPRRYVQAIVGTGPARRGPGYVVEYRDGSAEEHFRFETADLEPVLTVFDAFARHDDSYKTLVPWVPVPPVRRVSGSIAAIRS